MAEQRNTFTQKTKTLFKEPHRWEQGQRAKADAQRAQISTYKAELHTTRAELPDARNDAQANR